MVTLADAFYACTCHMRLASWCTRQVPPMPDPPVPARRLPFTPFRARTLGAIPVQLAGPVIEEPFSDVQLGPLLGKGAFGKVQIDPLAS